ncbi:MAG: hypothetical protein ACR2H4_09855 [Pyrinomonadaceae bacterium]
MASLDLWNFSGCSILMVSIVNDLKRRQQEMHRLDSALPAWHASIGPSFAQQGD